jgi:predicted acetyltransferase
MIHFTWGVILRIFKGSNSFLSASSIVTLYARDENVFYWNKWEYDMIEIREAREEDRNAAVRLLWRAFEATESFEQVKAKNWTKRWYQPKDRDLAFVAVEDQKVVSNVCFFISDNNIIRGSPVMSSGVWAVATEPHYRRRGLIHKLFSVSFPRMREEGAVLSILDPFYRPFYEKFGYALAEQRTKHVFKRDQLKYVKGPTDIVAHEASSSKDIDKIIEVEKSMARFGSRLFTPRVIQNEVMQEGNIHILERNSQPVGTVGFLFRKPNTGSGLDVTIVSTRFKTDDVFPAILELVYNYLANIQTATWWLDTEIPLRHFFLSHSAETYQMGSMMLRVIDFEKYCGSIHVPKQATKKVTVQLNDNQCPWNSGRYALVPSDGFLEVTRTELTPDITLSEFQLSEIISGISPATMLRAFGEIDCTHETAIGLESIFPVDTFVSYLRF